MRLPVVADSHAKELMLAIAISSLAVLCLWGAELGRAGNPGSMDSSIHQGDLVLSGSNVTKIEGSFKINGSIYVEGNATLVLKNAVINFTQTKGYQHKISLQNPDNGEPRLTASDSSLISTHTFTVVLHGTSSAMLDGLVTTHTFILESFDSSRVEVVDSTVGQLWAYGNSVLSVADSTVALSLRGSGEPTVHASNSTIKYLDTWADPRIHLHNCTITDWANVKLRDANSTVSGLVPGFHGSWRSLEAFSVAPAAQGFAPNITLDQTYVNGWQPRYMGSSNATIHDSALTSLDALHDAKVRTVNTTVLRYVCPDSGEIRVHWYLDVHVMDSSRQGLADATVVAAYPNLTEAGSAVTDTKGWARLTLMEKTVSASGEFPVGAYTIRAARNSFHNQTTVEMQGNKQIVFMLAEYPVPEPFPLLTLLLVLLGASCLRPSVWS